MRHAILTIGGVTIALMLTAGPARAAAIKEGRWSITSTIHSGELNTRMAEAKAQMEKMSPEDKAIMENMMGSMGMNINGGGQGMTATTTECITNNNPVPQADDADNCHETHSIKGNTVNFEMTCDNSHSKGQVTYKNDTMTGTIDSVATANGQEQNMTVDVSGTYQGPCDQAGDTPAGGMSDREMALKQKELDLKRQELDLQQREMDMKAAAKTSGQKPASKSAKQSVDDAVNSTNDAVNTTNNVKSTFSSLKSFLGR